MKKLFAFFAISVVASAHPMGNFSLNHYTAIKLSPGSVEIRYIIDMAEIPTFQEMQKTGMPAKVGDPAVNSYLAREQEILRSGLVVQLNDSALRLQKISHDVIFPPGAGGLPTMKMAFVYRASFENVRGQLSYRDTNFPDRAGWKEIIASAQKGVRILKSSVPAKDRSVQLTNYPTDTLASPPQDLEARIRFMPVMPVERQVAAAVVLPSAAPAVLVPNIKGTPKNAFTELVNKREWGFWFLLTAAFIAAGLGAFHALEPGHGKTIVAAYLVGSQGTALHACMLGLIVTASHTAGVYLLGAVTLYASRYILPERLYPWLGAFSGLTIAGLGIYLFWQRWRGKNTHGHSHPHTHSHSHSHSHPHSHAHDHAHPHEHHHHHDHPHVHGSVSKRQLLALGITGGIVPCPAALVVLLSAVALHRIAFGLFLILAFSIGLAAVLIAIGLLMVYARRFMAGVSGEGRVITRWLPITSSVFITVLGFAIAFRALGTV